MARMTRMLGAVVGSMALAAIPTAKGEAVPETEPNDTFPGQPATVGVTYTGTLCTPSGPSPCSPSDLIDFFHYTGLAPGTSFDLTFTASSFLTTLRAGLYTDQTTITISLDAGPHATVDLTGTVGAGGALTFGITEVTPGNFESYSIKLTATSATVPEPATIVLLAAGLTAAGVGAARRRHRS